MDLIKFNNDVEMKKCCVCGYKLQCRSCHKKQKQRKKRKTYTIPVNTSEIDENEMHIIFEGYFNDRDIQNFPMILK